MAHIDQDNTNSPAMGAGYTFDIDDAQDFLEHVFPNFTTFAFQSLPPKGTAHDDPARQQLTRLKVGTVDDAEDFLDDLTRVGANTYYCINQIRPDATDRKAASFIGTMGTVALDLDNSPIAPVINCFLQSHAIIYTSEGRAQLLWRIEGLTDQYVASDLIQRLARLFDGDAVIHDMARVLRLPGGFNHNHGEPCRVTWEPGGADAPYTMAEFVAAIEEIEQLKRLEPWVRSTKKPVERDGHVLGAGEAFVTSELLCEALSLLRNDGWADDDKTWERVAMAFARLSGGDPVVEDALRDWSHGSENDRSSIICDEARRGKLTYKPGAAGCDLARWLEEHHVEAERSRAIELASIIRSEADFSQNRAEFALVPLDPTHSQQRVEGETISEPAAGLPDIPGGSYNPAVMMREINKRFTLARRGGDVMVVHADPTGAHTWMTVHSFELMLRNVSVEISIDGDDDEEPTVKIVAASKWWLQNYDRPSVKTSVFKPAGDHNPASEFNWWRGWGVAPMRGTDKARPFLRHLREVVCKRDKRKFKYIMGWMAWVVQNPDLPAETVVVLQSEDEGTGKSTVPGVLLKIFGEHSKVLSSPDELLGTHAGEALEFCCFASFEEALFAGSKSESDKLKHRITGSTIFVNPKGSRAYSAPNRMSAMLATNHGWAIDAGRGARRWFIVETDDNRVGDRAWFENIYENLKAGGYGQLLHMFLTMELGKWHPRDLPRTEELAGQQLRSASSIVQWLVAGVQRGFFDTYDGSKVAYRELQLGEFHSTRDLHHAYLGYARANAMRVITDNVFGADMRKILGAENQTRRTNDDTGKRDHGYTVPQADGIVRKIEDYLRVPRGHLDKHIKR